MEAHRQIPITVLGTLHSGVYLKRGRLLLDWREWHPAQQSALQRLDNQSEAEPAAGEDILRRRPPARPNLHVWWLRRVRQSLA